MNPETHTCDCGFTWKHGRSGSHSCTPHYQSKIAELRAALEAAEQKLALPAPDLRLSIMRDSLLSAHEAFGKMLEYIDTGTPRRICMKQMQAINADLAKITLAAQPDSVMLQELLARIHRDGGHHVAAVGTEQAVKDADAIVAGIYAAGKPDSGRDAAPAVPSWKIQAIAENPDYACATDLPLHIQNQHMKKEIAAHRKAAQKNEKGGA